MPTLIIHLDGGLVQSAFKVNDKKPLSLIIVDTDTEDAGDEECLTKTLNEEGTEITAYVHQAPLDKLYKGCDVQRLVAQYLKDNK